ncbi:beta-galactosidase [Kribbella sp. NPDC051770]|uniref:beta-galactosidase n=1 Tax=Kribbella sp. NPDC051770 TaxID=3155413 RepID=UPI00342D92E4
MSAVTVAGGLLRVGRDELPLIAGEIQFWRMEPETWEPAVRAARAAGVTLISSYLSWRRHEPEQGRLDFTGRDDPRLDVRRFLRICADAGALVQLKPGPWICAEEPGGGYPDWLLERTELLVRDDQGEIVLGYNPPFQHPMPSYADERYLSVVEDWFAAVWAAIGDQVHPHGPVVALQLDNEPSLCFQDSLYGSDYSEASVTAYREWMRDRYGDTSTVWPPRRPSLDGPPSAQSLEDWIAFKTASTTRYLATLKQMHEKLGGQDLLYTVNLVTHPVHDVPVAHSAVRRDVGAATGEDHYYIPPLDTADIHRLARSAATARAAGEPLPWIPELQAGIWRSPGELVEYPDPTPLEQEVWWGAAVALGFAGFNLYMLGNRENWELAPLENDGRRSDFFAPIDQLVGLAHRRPDALTAPVVPSVVVAWHRPDAHAAYSVTGTSRLPDVDWYDEETAAPYRLWERTLLELTERGMPYDLWDTATELVSPVEVPVVIPPRCGVDPDQVAWLRAEGRTVIEVTDQLPALPSPALIGPGGRIPNTLIGIRPLPGELIVHVVHWGDGFDDSLLYLPGVPNGTLTDLTSPQSTLFRFEHAPLKLVPGHRVYAVTA